MLPTGGEVIGPIEIDPREIVTQIISLTINVTAEDDRWFVGHSITMPQVGLFKIAAATLDPRLGKTVTLIRDDWPTS